MNVFLHERTKYSLEMFEFVRLADCCCGAVVAPDFHRSTKQQPPKNKQYAADAEDYIVATTHFYASHMYEL